MVAKNFTPTKGQIHNTTGTICKASKQACPLDGGHSVDVESFISTVSESHGYDASVMRKYAAEGLPPEDILMLAKENARTVATFQGEKSAPVNKEVSEVVELIKTNRPTDGLSDNAVMSAYKNNSEELMKLREAEYENLKLFDEAQKANDYSNLAELRLKIQEEAQKVHEGLKKSLMDSGVSFRQANYLVSSRLPTIGLGEAYNGKNSRTGRFYTVEKGDLKQLSKGLFNHKSPQVQEGVHNYFAKNHDTVTKINKEIASYKTEKDRTSRASKIFNEEYQKNREAINRRRELLYIRSALEKDLRERKAMRLAGVKTNEISSRSRVTPDKVLADKQGFTNLFAKKDEKWYRIKSYDAGEYMQNDAAFVAEDGTRFSAVVKTGRQTPSGVSYLIDTTIPGEKIPNKSFGEFYQHN